MKKIRSFLAVIALAATLLSGLLPLGMGLGSLANQASNRHASSSFVVGQSTKSVAAVRQPPCPYSGADC
jgi:hypothetical protein